MHWAKQWKPQTYLTFRLCQATQKPFCLKYSQNHTLLRFSNYSNKKTLISNLTYWSLCCFSLLFLWETKLQRDDENEISFRFCATWSVIFIASIKITAETIRAYYIVSQNFNWGNSVRYQNMKVLTFLTYYLSICKNPSQILLKNFFRGCVI